MAQEWFQRPSVFACPDNLRAVRSLALGILDDVPDLCAWQERAASSGRHVTVYCLLTDALDDVRLAVADNRFDEVEGADVQGAADARLALYLFHTVFLHVEQLLRDLRNLPGRSHERLEWVRSFDGYINNAGKHRAESGDHHPYRHDHHLPVVLADMRDDPPGPAGINATLGVWVVPSLIRVCDEVGHQVQAFDRQLREGEEFRLRVEKDRVIPVEDLR